MSDGYAKIYVGNNRHRRGHRVMYELFHKLPELHWKEVIRHTCDVKCCVNPAHLIKGTQAENIGDTLERGRFR